ncbi:MAG: hypothetical protein QF664_14210 [Dehalococcoidia bacterium]|jgi:hypothetical protein|nr:hypothetical protein [Dehalococcoidia bacterium]|tara:strand:+ start:1187 stop:1480 length:294 start_codon:yes stop_codon:yes gene_type:complete
MILERTVFKAKYGRDDELVALLKEGNEMLAKYDIAAQRILTDMTGEFFTVVMETEVADLATYEASREAFQDPEFGPWFQRMMDLVETGSRDFWNIVE